MRTFAMILVAMTGATSIMMAQSTAGQQAGGPAPVVTEQAAAQSQLMTATGCVGGTGSPDQPFVMTNPMIGVAGGGNAPTTKGAAPSAIHIAAGLGRAGAGGAIGTTMTPPDGASRGLTGTAGTTTNAAGAGATTGVSPGMTGNRGASTGIRVATGATGTAGAGGPGTTATTGTTGTATPPSGAVGTTNAPTGGVETTSVPPGGAATATGLPTMFATHGKVTTLGDNVGAAARPAAIVGYQLTGADLTAYVGRRVEAAGTMVPGGANASAASRGTAIATSPLFQVRSIRVLPGACGGQ